MAAFDVGNCFLASPHVHTENALQGLLSRLESDQPDTHNHALAVEALSIDVARQVSLDEPLLEELRLGALLHDVGKLEVSPSESRAQRASLTAREWVTMRRHPGIGVRLLSPIIRSAEALAIVSFAP